MGNIKCCADEKINIDDNKKLFQLDRIKEAKKNKENSSSNKEEDINNDITLNTGQYLLLSYDVEENTLMNYIIKIPIITSLNGLSELNLNSKLYLCGTPSISRDASSYLFQITLQSLSTQIMVSSQYGHYYPSLISINSNKLLCIGGKKQTQCEIYDITINHWALFPELPEERYKCTLCYDYKNKNLYLFGGINSKKNSINTNYIEKENILMINTKNYYYSWEKILVESRFENKLLTRVSSAALFLDDNNIIILGGENENGKILKNIIKFNTQNCSISMVGKYLEFPSKFINQSTIIEKNEERNTIYFFDTKNNVHNINKQQFLSHLDKDELRINITV
jgi:hypothetical protein